MSLWRYFWKKFFSYFFFGMSLLMLTLGSFLAAKSLTSNEGLLTVFAQEFIPGFAGEQIPLESTTQGDFGRLDSGFAGEQIPLDSGTTFPVSSGVSTLGPAVPGFVGEQIPLSQSQPPIIVQQPVAQPPIIISQPSAQPPVVISQLAPQVVVVQQPASAPVIVQQPLPQQVVIQSPTAPQPQPVTVSQQVQPQQTVTVVVQPTLPQVIVTQAPPIPVVVTVTPSPGQVVVRQIQEQPPIVFQQQQQLAPQVVPAVVQQQQQVITPTPLPTTKGGLPVTGSADVSVQDLPQTGLPVFAWALAGLIPLGLGLRKMGRVNPAHEGKGHYIWQKREFLKESN